MNPSRTPKIHPKVIVTHKTKQDSYKPVPSGYSLSLYILNFIFLSYFLLLGNIRGRETCCGENFESDGSIHQQLWQYHSYFIYESPPQQWGHVLLLIIFTPLILLSRASKNINCQSQTVIF